MLTSMLFIYLKILTAFTQTGTFTHIHRENRLAASKELIYFTVIFFKQNFIYKKYMYLYSMYIRTVVNNKII